MERTDSDYHYSYSCKTGISHTHRILTAVTASSRRNVVRGIRSCGTTRTTPLPRSLGRSSTGVREARTVDRQQSSLGRCLGINSNERDIWSVLLARSSMRIGRVTAHHEIHRTTTTLGMGWKTRTRCRHCRSSVHGLVHDPEEELTFRTGRTSHRSRVLLRRLCCCVLVIHSASAVCMSGSFIITTVSALYA